MRRLGRIVLGHMAALHVAVAVLMGGGQLRAEDQPGCDPLTHDPRFTRIYRSPLLGRLWGRAEYLVWATKPQDLPPLVTSGPLDPLHEAGVLGQPGTSILLGKRDVNGEFASGIRLTLGFWWTPEQQAGVQVTYFGLADRNASFHSQDYDEPILARPFFNVTTGQQDRELVAYPDILDGQIDAEGTARFQGAEVLWRRRIYCEEALRLDVLAGYRFNHLFDRMLIDQTMVSLDASSGFDPGTFVLRSDNLHSVNHFHGAEAGLVAQWRRCCWSLELTGKIALGGTATSTTIDGATTIVPFGDIEDYEGGFLALPTNIGRYATGGFAVVPELGVSLQYHLTYYTRIAVGYDLMGWSHVTRATDQVDLGINPSQIPPDALVGEPRPRFPRDSEGFWAQGVSIRLESQF